MRAKLSSWILLTSLLLLTFHISLSLCRRNHGKRQKYYHGGRFKFNGSSQIYSNTIAGQNSYFAVALGTQLPISQTKSISITGTCLSHACDWKLINQEQYMMLSYYQTKKFSDLSSLSSQSYISSYSRTMLYYLSALDRTETQLYFVAVQSRDSFSPSPSSQISQLEITVKMEDNSIVDPTNRKVWSIIPFIPLIAIVGAILGVIVFVSCCVICMKCCCFGSSRRYHNDRRYLLEVKPHVTVVPMPHPTIPNRVAFVPHAAPQPQPQQQQQPPTYYQSQQQGVSAVPYAPHSYYDLNSPVVDHAYVPAYNPDYVPDHVAPPQEELPPQVYHQQMYKYQL